MKDKRPTLKQLREQVAQIKKVVKVCNHNWIDQQTGTVLIHKICSRCGAEKFD
jgi:hypothetical protein